MTLELPIDCTNKIFKIALWITFSILMREMSKKSVKFNFAGYALYILKIKTMKNTVSIGIHKDWVDFVSYGGRAVFNSYFSRQSKSVIFCLYSS